MHFSIFMVNAGNEWKHEIWMTRDTN